MKKQNQFQIVYKLVSKVSFLLCYSLFFIFLSCTNQTNSKAKVTTVQPGVQKPIVVEVVGPLGSELNADSLLAVTEEENIPASAVYQWKNHLVIFDSIKDLESLQEDISDAYPDASIKIYDAPFYEFNRKRCGDTTTAKEWENILLTANLVKDTAMQKEYLNYHATQFEKWPEVSKGFCNANFQQLLVYKNDQQLMLVISIPKGASLDELNPKTTENNPRVEEWNNIMKKYQEGIPGTKPGEVWVFLKPVISL